MTHNELTGYYQQLGTWARPLAHVLKSKYFDDLMSSLNTSYELSLISGRYPEIYPQKNNIFKAFNDCPYDELKFVVIAQDPYTNGRATGVAFANEDVDRISPELEELYKSIYGKEYDINPNIDTSLENLSKQGILFLNPILTVEENKPLSHWGLWNKFTIQVLEAISANKSPMIYSFLGSVAISFKEFVNPATSIILQHKHPSEAVRKMEPWSCVHFKTLNILLDRYNKQIVW